MNLIKILEPGLKAGYFSRDYVVDHPTMSRGLQEPKKKSSHNETWKIWNGQLFGYFCVVQQINLPNDEKSDQDGCEPPGAGGPSSGRRKFERRIGAG